MRTLIAVLAALVAAAGSSTAQSMMGGMMNTPPATTADPSWVNRPMQMGQPTTVIDQANNEKVTVSLDRIMGGYIKGVNLTTKRSWRADVRPGGSMRGKDIDGDAWKYDPRARLYTNLETGKTCEKTSLRRVCGP